MTFEIENTPLGKRGMVDLEPLWEGIPWLQVSHRIGWKPMGIVAQGLMFPLKGTASHDPLSSNPQPQSP